MHTVIRLIPFLLLSTCALGCSDVVAVPLAHSYESPETLAGAVLAAIERQDVNALRDLALNEQEFREHVWPELPASRPERNLPFGFVWGDLRQKSETALAQTLGQHGGRKYVLTAIGFTGDTTTYRSYRVRRQSEVTVRGSDGGERHLRLFGSVIEKDRRFKVFSYVIQD